MDFNYFDLIIGSIVLLLGLKGILNGFFKEVFGLIGIVGGVFIASRLAGTIGGYLSDAIFKFDSEAAVDFTGFLVVLTVFWGSMIALGIAFKKLSAASGLGPVDRILGFVFGASKFFFIVSIIVYALYNVKTIRVNIEKPMKNSILFPVMVEMGSFIMKMDPVDSVEKIKQKQDELQEQLNDAIKEHVTKEIKNSTEEMRNNLKETIKQTTGGE